MNPTDPHRTLQLLVRYLGFGILAAMVVRLLIPVTLSSAQLGYVCDAPGVVGAYTDLVEACRSVAIARVYDSLLWFGIAIALLAVANVLDHRDAEAAAGSGE